MRPRGYWGLPAFASLSMAGSERAELPTQGRSAQDKEGIAGNLDGRGPILGAQGLRSFCADVPGQVPEGGYLPGEGPGGPAGLLRLPGGALGAHPDDEPDRVDLCHDLPPDGPGQGLCESKDHVGDGLQAGDECGETLAQDPWIPLPGQGHRRCEVQRRNRSEQRDR